MDYQRLTKDELITIVRQFQSERMQNPSAIVESIRKHKLDYNRESFLLIVLNNKLKILKSKVLFTGGTDQALVDIKILMREAITTKRVSGIVIAHNHPSGDCTPSREDITLVNKMKEACKLLEIHFIDSIIFTEIDSLSMKEQNLL